VLQDKHVLHWSFRQVSDLMVAAEEEHQEGTEPQACDGAGEVQASLDAGYAAAWVMMQKGQYAEAHAWASELVRSAGACMCVFVFACACACLCVCARAVVSMCAQVPAEIGADCGHDFDQGSGTG